MTHLKNAFLNVRHRVKSHVMCLSPVSQSGGNLGT